MFVFIFVFSPSHSPFVSYVLSSHLLFQKRKRISRARLIRFDVPARVAKAISSSGLSLLPLPFERERTLYDREMPNSIKSRRSDLISRDAGERNVRRLNTSYRQNCLQTIYTGPSQPPRRCDGSRHRSRLWGTVITLQYLHKCVC